MSLTQQQLALLQDARLSDSARVLGLHLSEMGEGEHELSFDALAALLHGTPQSETIGKHMRQLTVHGYAERTSSGGRGSPRYKWLENSAPKIIEADDSKGRKKSGQSPTVVEEEGRSITPYGPPIELDERTLEVINRLIGCRGAVGDYLIANVPNPNRRYAYAQTVASWLDGADVSVWRLPGGGLLPADERPGMLAAALNELAAGEEADMKRRVGDPANLRTKLNVNLKRRTDHERNGNGTQRGRTAGKVGADSRANNRTAEHFSED